MIERELRKKIIASSKSYPVIVLTGPKQSGKTTLVKEVFPEYKYVNLEDIDVRSYAKNDPRAFLDEYQNGAIFDEVQNVPELFSYIQGVVDKKNQEGLYILTGSQNFLLLERISQSLAGRVSIFHLLPLSMKELKNSSYSLFTLEELLFKGFYPRIYSKKLDPSEWYRNYLQTYIERDLRSMRNIHDLGIFQLFLKMCASRTGQLLDLTSIGNDCGISHNTAREWFIF